MVKIAPSILSADFANLERDIKKVEKHADLLHIDVMDGHFVPNITFGPAAVAAIRRVTKLQLDVHLMIEQPEKYIDEFSAAGADSITIHVEAARNLYAAIKQVGSSGKKAAIAINPSTEISSAESIIENVDMILLMTVNPGFGGQKFIESVLPKIRELRSMIDSKNLNAEIQVDGGINKETAKLAVSAGADILVAGSYIYGSPNPAAAIKSLKK
ncbi:ribulose-phosphate 3-epimerase [Candidatus Woesearchaeota archaeon]|nr:ribulose-phosphate 3-epimerase [Candidatus Woesearchaeota archaeon]